MSNIYNETETNKLVNEENLEILREEDWLEAVFGVQSRLDNDTWLSKVVMKEANWVYDPKQLRAKLFKQAGITSRHWVETPGGKNKQDRKKQDQTV